MTLHTKLARHTSRRAFTLMEMLIVVAIIVALAGIGAFYVLPQLGKAKDKIAKANAGKGTTRRLQAVPRCPSRSDL